MWATDAGEEELLLDAMCICMEPLAAVAAALDPSLSTPRPWLPQDVSVSVPEAPFHLRLSCRGPATASADGSGGVQRLVLDVRLFGGGVIWLGLHQKGDGLDVAALQTSLFQVQGVLEPQEAAGTQSPLKGVWVRAGVLQSVLELVFTEACSSS